MCPIMGYCSRNAAMDLFENGFEETISRGTDDSRIVDKGEGILGFRKLAILRKELSGKYSFVGDSDCEILLPLYKEYGTEMFFCIKTIDKDRIVE